MPKAQVETTEGLHSAGYPGYGLRAYVKAALHPQLDPFKGVALP